MGKINGCLKCLFIFFNVLFAILGCLLIFGAVKASAYSHQMATVGGPSLGWSWVFAIGVLGISCLGIYAGCSEKALALKIFAGFMGVGMVIMLIFGIIIAVTRNKIKNGFDSASSELSKSFMEDEEMRLLLEGLQETAQCCGVVSASDWGNNIPSSCDCKSPYGPLTGLGMSGCKAKPQDASGPEQIYRQTCSDFIFIWLDLVFKIAMGFFFGFAVTALLGLLVTLLMIYQVKRHDGSGGSSIAMKGY
ncbi:tetraspanin-17-like [Plectropomus leopardus]|uniref:tetraspanin-17-like n=1 Tax=Plectropomus leopardus TaxID=160734 RepID=UPI001C4D845C|nr:tetraspanin-17-like [Plectropomus leopardus]